MLLGRPLKIFTGVVVSSLLIAVGFAIFMARVAVFPWWYNSRLVGKELPKCSSYQSEVYLHCHDPKKSLGLEYTEFNSEKEVDGRNVRVSGWWIEPRSTVEHKGVVILVHGGGADRRAMLKHASYLHAAGYHALLIDCHNHGLNKYDGKGISFGLWESESVILAAEWAITHIRKRGESGRAEALPIVAMGTSQGAFAALRAAAGTDLIRGVVAENPYVSATRVLAEFPTLSGFPRFVKEMSFAMVSIWLGRSIWDIDVKNFAERIGRKPVFLIHGEQDIITDIKNSEEIAALLPGAKGLWRVPGGKHEALINVMGQTYEKKILEFLSHEIKL